MLSHFSRVWLSATPWTVTLQVPLSIGFSRQEYWRGWACPPWRDLSDPGIKTASPMAPALQADSLLLSQRGSLQLYTHLHISVYIYPQPQISRWYNSNGRKPRGTKDSLDEGERGEWKAGLKLHIEKTKVMASGPIASWQIDGKIVETVADFIFLGSKITVDSDCSHEIKRRLLLGRKATTNLDNVLKSRDISLPTKVHIIKTIIFPVVMYGCEKWTINKDESDREVAQPYLTLCDHMDYTVHGVLQARILEWVAIPFSSASSQPRDGTQVSHIAGRFFISWAIREAHKESWAPKNWCFWIVMLEKTLENPSDSKDSKPVNPKGNQPWIFIERTDAEAEAPILWPSDVNSQLTGKDPDIGKDWRQKKKGAAEDEMVGWYHWFNGHEFEQASGDSEGQERHLCGSSWACKESDTNYWMNSNNNCIYIYFFFFIFRFFP